MISISTSFRPDLSTCPQSSIKSISSLVPSKHFWTTWRTVLWEKQSSSTASSQLRDNTSSIQTLWKWVPSLPLLSLSSRSSCFSLSYCSCTEAEQLFSHLHWFDLSVTAVGTDVLSSGKAVSWLCLSLLSWGGTAWAIAWAEHMFLLDFMYSLSQMIVN